MEKKKKYEVDCEKVSQLLEEERYREISDHLIEIHLQWYMNGGITEKGLKMTQEFIFNNIPVVEETGKKLTEAEFVAGMIKYAMEDCREFADYCFMKMLEASCEAANRDFSEIVKLRKMCQSN